MARLLEFDRENKIYAYSVESLIELCKELEYKRTAIKYINERKIEQWLFEIGELELSEIVKNIRKNDNNKKLETLVDECTKHLNKRKFIDLLDINRAIDTTLKEYEALRAEILQNASEVSQLILLGLAAIFTITSLGLAPLAGFLTKEDIEIVSPIVVIEDISSTENKQKKTYRIDNFDENQKNGENPNKDQKQVNKNQKNGKNPNKDQKQVNKNQKNGKNPNEDQKKLVITRTTKEKTIREGGIFPSLVVINWLIPGLCLYLIYRSLYSIRKNKIIGRYISHRIEKKLIKLNREKAKYQNCKIEERTDQKHLTHISWENYIKQDDRYLEPLDVNLIFWLFSFIILISLIGGFFLCCNYDLITFDCDQDILEFLKSPLFLIVGPVITFLCFLLYRIIIIIFIIIILIMVRMEIIISVPLSAWVLWFIPCFLSIFFLIVLLQKTMYVSSLNKIQLHRDKNWWFIVRKYLKIFFAKLLFWAFFICQILPKNAVNQRLYNKRKLNHQFPPDWVNPFRTKIRENNECGIHKITLTKLGNRLETNIKEETLHKSRDNFKEKLQELDKDIQKITLLEAKQLTKLLRKTNKLLNEIDDFILSKQKDHITNPHEIYVMIDSLLLETLTLRSIDRWNNPEIIFDSVFEDVLDEMWDNND